MKKVETLLGTVLLLSLACSGPTAPGPDAGSAGSATPSFAAASATANLKDGTGRTVGRATLSEAGGSVRVVVDVEGLPPGEKALHIHEVGRCQPPSFESAQAHFNPLAEEHGTANPRGPHAGDLPNIAIDASGRGHLEITTTRVSLSPGPMSVFDRDGSAMIIHAAPDDMRSDPGGNSGARIACGDIVRDSRG
jgi:superoxide dismutase, Cu-Zn family